MHNWTISEQSSLKYHPFRVTLYLQYEWFEHLSQMFWWIYWKSQIKCKISIKNVLVSEYTFSLFTLYNNEKRLVLCRQCFLSFNLQEYFVFSSFVNFLQLFKKNAFVRCQNYLLFSLYFVRFLTFNKIVRAK